MIDAILSLGTTVVGKIIYAIIILIVGNILIKSILKLLDKSKALSAVEGTVRTFTKSFVKIGLYCLLVIAIVGTLGVEMSSIAAVIASAGVTVGLALQGALSNLAGGIMLMVFKPFKLGDYIEAAGGAGSVSEVTLFYTVLVTPDNKRITIPNGTLMNSNITDYSSEEVRRVDLSFSCAKSENPAHVQSIILDAISACPYILDAPEKPFANVSGGTNEAMEFAARAWCKSGDYWSTYFDLSQRITEALGRADVQAPAVRVVSDK